MNVFNLINRENTVRLKDEYVARDKMSIATYIIESTVHHWMENYINYNIPKIGPARPSLFRTEIQGPTRYFGLDRIGPPTLFSANW